MRRLVLFGFITILALIEICSAPARAQDTWTDPATGLMWTHQDNGTDINWYQANSYCANLQSGGYSNWRLATITELEAISVERQDSDSHHIKTGILLSFSGSVWSSSAGEASGEAWVFEFNIRYRNSCQLSWGHNLRALCVRHP
ncbi:MAG TPA: DUF1566 domain-containing protein [Terracidiphilus sp.]|nr:DUF1566 domain-containing protein [Terracidiphilus sp.]